MKRFKKGAASFYIISFSTLILVIIAASFATIIISEVTRASNDDLSQSAYDAALAGVEDAKIAYANYRRCLQKAPAGGYVDSLSGDSVLSCQDIVYFMNHPAESGCDMVALMIGRISKVDWLNGTAEKEVLVSDTVTVAGGDKTTSELNQAYTCVKIETTLKDYRANLTSANNARMVRVKFANGVNASSIKSVKIGWYSVNEEILNKSTLNFSNFLSSGTPQVTFKPADASLQPPTPPALEVQLVQSQNQFTISELNSASSSDRTDRATLFLVPTNRSDYASNQNGSNYVGVYKNGVNEISVAQVAKTNDRSISNKPYVTYCSDNSDEGFACSVTVNLPLPIGDGSRNSDTFTLFVTLPYGEPDTDFALEFHCNGNCPMTVETVEGVVDKSMAYLDGSQVLIDSTGRANDLYRRVETRLESVDTTFPYTYYALQLLNTGSNDNYTSIKKTLEVTSEYNRNY